ncbi:MAG: PAS domain S-box protein [Bryobacterales bacterium]|nr:PAS domain S-box protein [Bryobacterales bacterium]
MAHPGLRATVESSHSAVVATTVAGVPVLVNESAREMFGPDCESAGETWRALLVSLTSDPAMLKQHLDSIDSNPAQSCTLQLHLKDGRIVQGHEEPQLVRRRMIGRVWRFRDITEQHRAQEELRATKERLELGLLGTQDGIFDWDMRTGRVYATRVGDCSLEDTYRWVHPDDLARMQEATRAHLENDVPYDIEYRTHPPGHSRMRWARARGRVLRDSAGTPYRFVGCFTDITAKKEAVEALERREREYRTVLSQIQEVVFEATVDGMLRYLNPAWTRLLGHDIEECLGVPLLNFVDPEDRERLQLHLQLFDQAVGSPPIECRWITKSGDSRWLELRPGRFGEVAADQRMFGSLADVEMRRAAQEQQERARQTAEQANRAKSEFIAAISHELRTPLNVIAGSSELLLETSLRPDSQHYAEVIHSNARALTRLINDLLDISRIEAGQIDIEAVPFDPVLILEAVCDQFRAAAQSKGLLLDLLLLGRVPDRLIGDPGRLRQITSNLVGNAVKFTRAGRIHVTLKNCGSGVRIAVKDDGEGIPAEAVERIFEKFVQLRTGSAQSRLGVGLGLTISRRLAEAMRGRLYVESEVGKGSCFTVELPLPPAEGEPGIVDPAFAGLRVAVQTPDKSLRNSLKLLLERVGGVFLPCRGPSDLTRLLNDGGCDILLLDFEAAHSKAFQGTLTLAESLRIVTGRVVGAPGAMAGRMALDRPLTLSRLRRFLADTGVRKPNGARNAHRMSAMKMRKRPPRVLVVDDNAESLSISAAIVRHCGCEVDAVTGGNEAVARFQATRYDLILMDVEMPDLDGLEATRQIRAVEQAQGRPRVPIVALTAYALDVQRENCRLAGMDDYQAKPASMEELTSKIEQWIPSQPVLLCIGAIGKWSTAVARALSGATEYQTIFASGESEAVAVLRTRQVSAVLVDGRAGRPDVLREALAQAGDTPQILVSDNPDPNQLLKAVEDEVWVTKLVAAAPMTSALVSAYLENRLRDVAAIKAALDSSDLSTVQRIAHNLKGVAPGLGFPQLGDLGREMEALAKSGMRERILTLNGELEQQLRAIQRSLLLVRT